MSTSITKATNKRLFKNKMNNLMITPLFSNQTTANSTNKNTLIVNSRNENIKNYENFDKENISPNIILKIDNKNLNFINKKKYLKKNSPKGRNFPLKNYIKTNLDKTNETINSKKICHISINKSNDLNTYRSNYNKKNCNKNIFENKNIYFIDKILNKKKISDHRNNSKLQQTPKMFSNANKRSFSKENMKKNNNVNNKNVTNLSYDNKKNFNKKAIPKNCKLKISSLVKKHNINYNNTNINHKSNTNSKNKSQNDKNIYFKKKIDDSFKYINIKKIMDRKFINQNLYNNLSNHNFLVNLILDEEKNYNNNIKLYNIINNKNINKNLEINNKSNLYTKCSDSNKKSIPKPIISKNKNEINSIKESPIKGLPSILDINNHKTHKNINNKKYNQKNYKINKRSNKLNYRENKSFEKSVHKSKNKNSNNQKNRNKKLYKSNLNKQCVQNMSNKVQTSENSILKGKDSYLDYLIDSFSKSKNKRENIRKLINDIKINNYSIKKPKEENMKFTLLKNKLQQNEENTQEINKSKIIIGYIEGYKDIIESDKINNNYSNKEREKENTIKIFENNTIDSNINDESKNRNKKLLLNISNNELEIYNENNINNNCFINDSEIKTFLDYIEDEYEFQDLSTTFLKKNQKNENILLPFHVNKISFIKIYNENSKNYIIKENVDNDNVLLIDIIKKKNKANKRKQRIDLHDEFFFQKDMLLKNKNYFSCIHIKKQLKNNEDYNLSNHNKKILNIHNKIQNNCNFTIEVNDKKCVIF